MYNRKDSPEVRKAILAAIEEGQPKRYAAAAAGVGHSAFYAWCKEDTDFAAEVAEAEAIGQKRLIEVARKAALVDQDAHWAAWMLVHRWPLVYGRRAVQSQVKHEVSGHVGIIEFRASDAFAQIALGSANDHANAGDMRLLESGDGQALGEDDAGSGA
jgi:hypothetical protein